MTPELSQNHSIPPDRPDGTKPERRWAFNTLPTMDGEAFLTDADVVEIILSDLRHGHIARQDIEDVLKETE